MLNSILFSTGSDNFIEGLGIAVSGFLITFVVLILICFILYLFGKAFHKPAAETKAEEVKTEEIPAAPVEQAVTESAATDDAELVAAITAAVACCLGRSTDGFVVRSFRRIGKRRGR